MSRHLIGIDDLTLDEVDSILDRARAIVLGDVSSNLAGTVVGTLFVSSSLRTRVGFSTAALRLGAQVVDIAEYRNERSMSGHESLEDTLRTIAGMVDLVVARAPVDLRSGIAVDHLPSPLICGGDLQHHPTQTLIDVFAMRRFVGPEVDLRVGVYGDLSMRAPRSLIEYFSRRPPKELRLSGPRGRELSVDLSVSSELSAVLRFGDALDLADLDVLYVVGLPPGDGERYLSTDQRAPYVIGADHLAASPPHAVILCPMPVVDELSPEARADSRLKVWAQSDDGVGVRMAVIDHVVRHFGRI